MYIAPEKQKGNSDLTVMPGTWFSPTVQYEGEAHAEFADPAGVVDCPAKASVGETGAGLVSMVLEKRHISCSADLPGGVVQFIYGQRFGSHPRNPLQCMSVETSDGSLSVTRIRWISIGMIDFDNLEQASEVNFQVDAMRFVSRAERPARYFAIPLLNFVSDFCDGGTALRDHPLRMRAGSGASLIVFQRNGSLAFIEPLPDYEDRTQQITGKKTTAIITAILAGDLTIDEGRLCKVRPGTVEKLLHVVSFAAGTFVGTPWIEYRDGEGGLVARDHMCLGLRPFEDGHRVIREAQDRGTGRLLTAATTKFDSTSDPITMSMVYAVKTGLCRGGSVEDMLRAVANGLECLFEHAGIKEGSFGRKLLELLQRNDLPDADLAEKYYAGSSILKGAKAKSWHELIAKYRNKAAHTGYFELAEGKYDLLAVRGVADHLHDILIRSILIEAGYKGTYQTSLSPSITSVPINWLTEQTFPNMLGRYKPAYDAPIIDQR